MFKKLANEKISKGDDETHKTLKFQIWELIFKIIFKSFKIC